MRTLIEALTALLVAVFFPMLFCELVFAGRLKFGESVCGHNGGIQILLLSVVGAIVVFVRAMNRQRNEAEDKSRGRVDED